PDLERRRDRPVRGDSFGRLDRECELRGSPVGRTGGIRRERWRRRVFALACLRQEREEHVERYADGTPHGTVTRGGSRLGGVAMRMPLAALSARAAWCCGASTSSVIPAGTRVARVRRGSLRLACQCNRRSCEATWCRTGRLSERIRVRAI